MALTDAALILLRLAGVISIMTLLAVDGDESLPASSEAITRKYHVPSAKLAGCVNDVPFVLADSTPRTNDALWLHCTVYAGLARPEPLSDALAHVHVGRWLFVGVVVDGVPGVVGAVVSTIYVMVGDHADMLPNVSRALTLRYQVPAASAGVV